MRRTALFLVALACAGSVAQAAAKPRTSWAQDEIERVVARGVMGPGVAAFRPNTGLLRSELAQARAALRGDTAR
ncbi:MAG: hypothetical protein H0V40_08730, partial [Actinobacteria bacterium]|nr:hypothetical protein [Actinomycetota bacterium]